MISRFDFNGIIIDTTVRIRKSHKKIIPKVSGWLCDERWMKILQEQFSEKLASAANYLPIRLCIIHENTEDVGL